LLWLRRNEKPRRARARTGQSLKFVSAASGPFQTLHLNHISASIVVEYHKSPDRRIPPCEAGGIGATSRPLSRPRCAPLHLHGAGIRKPSQKLTWAPGFRTSAFTSAADIESAYQMLWNLLPDAECREASTPGKGEG